MIEMLGFRMISSSQICSNIFKLTFIWDCFLLESKSGWWNQWQPRLVLQLLKCEADDFHPMFIGGEVSSLNVYAAFGCGKGPHWRCLCLGNTQKIALFIYLFIVYLATWTSLFLIWIYRQTKLFVKIGVLLMCVKWELTTPSSVYTLGLSMLNHSQQVWTHIVNYLLGDYGHDC